MQLNESIYLSSENWYTVFPTINANYQNENPIQAPAYYTVSNYNYGCIYFGAKQNHIPWNRPIDNSICYAGSYGESPINNWKYARLSEAPSEINVINLGFSADTKNNVSFSHSDNNIILNGTLNTSSNTILIFDLAHDATSSTQFQSNPFSRTGEYIISPTNNSNIRVQLYGYNNDLQLVNLYNSSSGGTVNIDLSYSYYVFRLWIAGNSSFNNYSFTCKCVLKQERSVITDNAANGEDAGIFLAISPTESFYSTAGDGIAQRFAYYNDIATASGRSKCQYYSIPVTRYNYKDVVFVIYVECSDTITGAIRTYDLNTYKNSYATIYPIIRAFYMRPYIGNPDNGYNRRYYFNSLRYEPTGGVNDSSLTCTSNMPFLIPNNFNIPASVSTSESIFYMYGFGRITPKSGTLFGISGVLNMANSAGMDDYSFANELYQCNMHRITEDFSYYVDGYNVRTVYNGSLDDIINICAWFGFPFTESQYIAETASVENIQSEKLHIPIIENGYITGRFLSGSEANELPNISWGEDFRDKNEYDGEEAEKFNMETELRPNNLAASSPFTYQYIIEPSQIQELKDFLYTTITTDTDETELFQKFLTNNPIDTIVSLCVFPFNVEDYCNWVAGEHVITGNVDTGIIAKGLYSGLVVVVDGGEIRYRDKYKDFRSYEPYCDAEIFIPYHGSIHIAPSEMLGHTLGIKYIVDICSGASIALLFRDGLAIDSISGQIGGALRLTGIQTASYHNSVYQANATLKQQKIGLATQTASFGVKVLNAPLEAFKSKDVIGTISGLANSAAGLAQSAIEVNKTEYQLNHVQIPYKAIGANTVFSSMGNEQFCRLILKRPLMLNKYDAAIYGHTKGFACCITDKLSNYHGYTEIQSIDLSDIPCTNEEQKILESLLIAGVYL